MTSPRKTQPYHTDELSPTSTSPTTTAPSATNTPRPRRGDKSPSDKMRPPDT
ncbi:MAG: hypothetical protein MPJ82_03325 [Alphaproteobacteria bacterium]|nr:hypothetical protein [Alphaproteobacteria bacterium]